MKDLLHAMWCTWDHLYQGALVRISCIYQSFPGMLLYRLPQLAANRIFDFSYIDTYLYAFPDPVLHRLPQRIANSHF